MGFIMFERKTRIWPVKGCQSWSMIGALALEQRGMRAMKRYLGLHSLTLKILTQIPWVERLDIHYLLRIYYI